VADARTRRLRFLQFRLRSLLLVMVAVGVAFAWFGPQIREWFLPGEVDPGPTLTIGLDPSGLNDWSLDLYPPFVHSLSDR